MAAQSTHKHSTDTPTVKFSSVRIAAAVVQHSRNSQTSARISMSQQEALGPPVTPEVLDYASWREMKISKHGR